MRGEKVYLDTSGLIALISRNDKFHEQAVGFLANKPSLVTSIWVIEEFLAHLHTRYGKGAAVKGILFLEDIPNLDIVFLDSQILRNSFKLFREYASRKISVVDVNNVVIMRSLGIKNIFCFDERFATVFSLKIVPG